MSVHLEYSGHTAIITIDNPKQLGALTQDMQVQLGHHMRAAGDREDVHVTLLTGTGRFFSSGASIHANRTPAPNEDTRRAYVHQMVDLLDIAQTFYTHSNVLVTALNGPVVGLASALVSHSDFIYSVPNTYLLSPFTSIGYVAEGATTRSMINRMGTSLAKEALFMARKITLEELRHSGFVNGVFDVKDAEALKLKVLEEVCEGRLGSHLRPKSIVETKRIMNRSDEIAYDAAQVRELVGGVKALERGEPQDSFVRLRSKEKRHKL